MSERFWCAIVFKDLGHCVWTNPAFSFEFATGVSLDHYLISRVVGVLTSCGIFGFVVLDDAVLFPLLDALPIGFKGDVQQSIPAKR